MAASVVILDTSSPDEMTGGQSVFVRTILTRLAGRVRVVGASSREGPHGVWQPCELRGVPYEFMAVAHMDPPGRRPLVPLRLAALLGVARYRRRIIDAGDVMYVQSPEMGLPLTIGPGRKPVVLHLHGSANPLTASRYPWARRPALQRAYARLLGLVVTRSRLVLSVDQAGLRAAEQIGRGAGHARPQLLPICVDEQLFHPRDRSAALARLSLPPSSRLIVFVGRLEADKGPELLVDTLRLLQAYPQRVVLAVLGDGSQQNTMRRRARQAGALDTLMQAGWVSHDELGDWLSAADLLLLPSAHEGLPTVALEALACGVPVVASAVGGLPSIIHDGQNGRLVTDRTAEAFAAAVTAVLDTHWSKPDLAASVADYSAASVAARLGDLLDEAAA